MKPPKTIWVFRTSVATRMDLHRLKPVLDRLMPADDKWNFDLEDCDHILRIETRSVSDRAIIDLLANEGYRCEELEDIPSMTFTTFHSFESDYAQTENAMWKN
ncbi:MAG TPA: hypothetical protein VLA46_12425 [Saprospiraceae bacterium]|nr:hypothetical protein [Saprospiraceae bacterium]